MKKLFLAFAVVASALALGSCSSDEPVPTPGAGEISTGEPKYLSVNIKAAVDSRSRAEGDEVANKDYEDGLEAESLIKSVDFYFFDENGAPAKVKNDGSNHMPATPGTVGKPGPEGQDNITVATEAVLVIQTPEGDKIPTQIVAVVNKEAAGKYAGLSISQLQNRVTEGITKDGYFVMTNSVYVAGNAEHIGADVAGHLYNDPEEAQGDPVKIYVERTLGKVHLTSTIKAGVTLADGTVLYDPKKDDKDEVFTTTEGDGEVATTVNTKIYVKFLGWNTTTTSTLNRLVKLIDPMWNGGWNWYDAYRFRSFWAVNADKEVVLNDDTHPVKGNEIKNFKFEGDNEAATGKTKFDGSDYVYLKENAAVSLSNVKPENPSQVIIAAQLVDEKGKSIEIAEWAGQRMSVSDLTKALANAATLYKKVEDKDAEGNTIYIYTKIEPSDIELKTASQAGQLDASNGRRYLVYATLTDEAAGIDWYKQALNNDNLNPVLKDDEIKTIFASLGGAKVWTEGKSYFYFDIRHLAWGIETASFGQLGVVRNHVYDASVSNLVGLGTPVYDPDEVIIPEKPEDDETFIAAEINVLSWRIVNQNHELNW